MMNFNIPIALVGIGCRFPGNSFGADTFWQFLRSGGDGVRAVPERRFRLGGLPCHVSESEARTIGHAALVDAVDEFDPEHFSISPREAEHMDPQQRMLLMVAWEAIEDAGIAPTSIAGSNTGVFVGVSNVDYHRMIFRDMGRVNHHSGTGTALSVTAARLSYTFDLKGPSIAIDTACSSSLVAIHLACQALRSAECDLALAGGVSLILNADVSICHARARMLAADGKCKTFDGDADGFVRGEGCGVVVLKRLADARRDGDRVIATVLGSAVNHDGLSNGLTAPNGPAQQAVIRRALHCAGVDPSAVSYVEAHGTGTSLGDPIEVKALAAAYARDSPGAPPMWTGSVKTNIGHLEAAAGVAGFIKTALAVQRDEIPPHLHFAKLNPYIHLADTSLAIPSEVVPWSAALRGTARRTAGVSAFSFGGTNCHVIVAEAAADPVEGPVAAERPWHALYLSARSGEALQEMARRHGDALSASVHLADFCHSCNLSKSSLAHRAVVVGRDRAALRQGIACVAGSEESEHVFRGCGVASSVTRTLGLWFLPVDPAATAADELCATSPTFRDAFRGMQERFAARARGSAPDATTFFTLCAIGHVLQSWGLRPSRMGGDGVGALCAAHLTGAIDEARAFDALEAGRELSECEAQPQSPAAMGTTLVLPVDVSSRDPWKAVVAAAARAECGGFRVDWRAFDAPYRRKRVSTPRYPFRCRPFWFESRERAPEDGAVSQGAPAARYTIRWTEMAQDVPAAGASPSAVWVVQGGAANGSGGMRDAIVEELGRRGEFLAPLEFVLAPPRSNDRHPCVNLVWIAAGTSASSTEDTVRSVVSECAAFLEAAQTARSLAETHTVRLWCATRGGQAVAGEPCDPGASALWGLARSMRLELAASWGGAVDVELGQNPATFRESAQRIVSLVRGRETARDGDDQFVLRGGRTLVPRLVAVEASSAPPGKEPIVRADRTYVITGGFGGIGRHLIRWLAAHGARHIAVFGRRPAHEAAPSVRYFQGSLGDRAFVRESFASITRQMPPVARVYHAAGVVGPSKPCASVTAADLEAAFEAKVAGAMHLREAIASFGAPVEHFVSFSSIASAWGSARQACYAAANGFLDGFAPGGAAFVRPIHWGPWDGTGMAAESSARRTLERRGIRAMSPEACIEAMERALEERSAGALVCASIDWSTFVPTMRTAGAGAIFEAIAGSNPASPSDRGDTVFVADLRARAAVERERLVEDFVADAVATILKLESPTVDRTAGFADLGMDSLMAIELQQRLETALGLSVPSTVGFDHPTITALARYLTARLFPAVADRKPRRRPAAPVVAPANDYDGRSEVELERMLSARLDAMEGRL
jgi:acyl transferase domain-containing protein